MASSAEIPLVDGTFDGETITVELDPNGRPPLTHHHVGAGGLAEAEIYELESAEGEPGWRYCWRGPAT
ncbi:hypothetical protein O7606_27470 [Micromonospora sp. WMMD882]|uniref:hypothetical protein n=1 Tax=Micromonospora sp. WMMD882 TaxID=3015151 RepID=UPI00248D19AB|nr:hypothetical protein [Micromonospora sp. WMMD882]WBB79819.1 hypothetical protein O7606_27470 [Micromonospora sp. WMMD882]